MKETHTLGQGGIYLDGVRLTVGAGDGVISDLLVVDPCEQNCKIQLLLSWLLWGSPPQAIVCMNHPSWCEYPQDHASFLFIHQFSFHWRSLGALITLLKEANEYISIY